MSGEISFIVMILTGISLAMDAFAVSISCGFSCGGGKNTLPTATKVAVFFGFFQGMMILIGWLLGFSFKNLITRYDHWVAFALLVLIGGKMMHDAAEEGECTISLNSTKMLIWLSLATSIDALAVGVSFSVLNITQLTIVITALIVGVITFLFCFSGICIGAKVACRPKWKSRIDMAGGFILIALGFKILLESTIFY